LIGGKLSKKVNIINKECLKSNIDISWTLLMDMFTFEKDDQKKPEYQINLYMCL